MEILIVLVVVFIIFYCMYLMMRTGVRATVGTARFVYNTATKTSRQEREAQILEAQRQEVLTRVRSDPYPFAMDSSVRIDSDAYLKSKNYDAWAAAINARAAYFQERTNTAAVLVNDDIQQLEAYRSSPLKDTIQSYDLLIARYRDDIKTLVPNPQVQLKYKDHLRIDLFKPGEIRKTINKESDRAASKAYTALHRQNVSNGAAIGVGVAIGVLTMINARSKARSKLREDQAKLEVYAKEAQGTLEALRPVHQHVSTFRAMHEESARNLADLTRQVSQIIDTRRQQGQPYESFHDLTADEQATFEQFYGEGERLKQLVAMSIL